MSCSFLNVILNDCNTTVTRSPRAAVGTYMPGMDWNQWWNHGTSLGRSVEWLSDSNRSRRPTTPASQSSPHHQAVATRAPIYDGPDHPPQQPLADVDTKQVDVPR